VPPNDEITVVIPCFNHGRFLAEAVESALGQRGGPPKVVVVDDGSTEEETQAALEALPDGVERVRQANAGPAAARNAGIERSQTPLLLMLDADDRLTPAAIETLRGPLSDHPEVGYCYGVMRLFGGWSGEIRFPDFDPYRLLYRSIAGASLGLIRRRAWEEAGRFDPSVAGYEDWDFCLGALEHGWRGLQVGEVTLEYRKHEHSGQFEHRRRYRKTYRQLRAKHAALYARRREFAAETDLGPAGRLLYRTYWAWRPLPAPIERAIYSLVFR
jgi:glycosyltransferase involved in cell wall biosynthesis